MPCATASSKLLSDVELISTIRAIDIVELPSNPNYLTCSSALWIQTNGVPSQTDAQSRPLRCSRREKLQILRLGMDMSLDIARLPDAGEFEWNQCHRPVGTDHSINCSGIQLRK